MATEVLGLTLMQIGGLPEGTARLIIAHTKATSRPDIMVNAVLLDLHPGQDADEAFDEAEARIKALGWRFDPDSMFIKENEVRGAKNALFEVVSG